MDRFTDHSVQSGAKAPIIWSSLVSVHACQYHNSMAWFGFTPVFFHSSFVWFILISQNWAERLLIYIDVIQSFRNGSNINGPKFHKEDSQQPSTDKSSSFVHTFEFLLLWVFGSVSILVMWSAPLCAPRTPPQVSTYVPVVVLQAARSASSFTPAAPGVRKTYVY